jgi:hypothetical protein
MGTVNLDAVATVNFSCGTDFFDTVVCLVQRVARTSNQSCTLD